jgi:predicted transcriptional regulator
MTVAPNPSKFLNVRDWRTFLAAKQTALTNPLRFESSVLEAMQSSRAWFLGGAAQTSKWLLASVAACEPRPSKIHGAR